VIALGSYSTPLLGRIGISIPVYPVKGYSITLPLEPGSVAPRISLTDHARKIVLSRLGDRLRVAGTAEVNGYDTEMNEGRCNALVRRCFECGFRWRVVLKGAFWTGLRPATPSNLPLIGDRNTPTSSSIRDTARSGGRSRAVRARALADIVSGRRPEPEFDFLGMEARTKRATSYGRPRQPARTALLRANRQRASAPPPTWVSVPHRPSVRARNWASANRAWCVAPFVVLQMGEPAIADSNVDLAGAYRGNVGRIRALAHRPQAAVERDDIV